MHSMGASNHFVNCRVHFGSWILARKYEILKIGVKNLIKIWQNNRLGEKSYFIFVKRGLIDKSGKLKLTKLRNWFVRDQ